MSKHIRQDHNDGFIRHKKKQYERQIDKPYATTQTLDKMFSEYKQDVVSYYKHHTTLALGALAVSVFGIIYFNQEIERDVADLYDGSW
jgi:hypothetical protein